MQQQLLHNQNLLDFVLHHTGTLAGFMDFIFENKLPINNDVIVGQKFDLAANITIDKDIRDYFYFKNYIPATGQNLTQPEEVEQFPYEFVIEF